MIYIKVQKIIGAYITKIVENAKITMSVDDKKCQNYYKRKIEKVQKIT